MYVNTLVGVFVLVSVNFFVGVGVGVQVATLLVDEHGKVIFVGVRVAVNRLVGVRVGVQVTNLPVVEHANEMTLVGVRVEVNAAWAGAAAKVRLLMLDMAKPKTSKIKASVKIFFIGLILSYLIETCRRI